MGYRERDCSVEIIMPVTEWKCPAQSCRSGRRRWNAAWLASARIRQPHCKSSAWSGAYGLSLIHCGRITLSFPTHSVPRIDKSTIDQPVTGCRLVCKGLISYDAVFSLCTCFRLLLTAIQDSWSACSLRQLHVLPQCG